MNWKKILLATIGGAFAGTVGHWAGDAQTGGHVPFTTGTIVLPALTTIISTLGALFVQPPHNDGKTTTKQ